MLARAHRTSSAVLVLAVGMLQAAAAPAQSALRPPERAAVAGRSATTAASLEQQASAHFQRGIERFDAAEYALSLVEFQRAYALRPSYQLLFNIGQVHYHLRQYASARVALEAYLERARGNVASERRVQVEQQLSSLRARTAELRIVVNVTGAEVSINDELLGTSPLVAAAIVDAGTQRVVASKPGYSSARATIAVTGGELAPLSLTLQALFTASARTPDPLPETLAWVGAGALAAGAIGTGLATLLASRRYDELRNGPLTGAPSAARGRLDEQQSLVSTLATSTDILAGASLAAVGVALYFTLRAPPAAEGSGLQQARSGANGLCTWLEF